MRAYFVLLHLPNTDAILGLPFFTKHDPTMASWQENYVPNSMSMPLRIFKLIQDLRQVSTINAQNIAKLLRRKRKKGDEKSRSRFFYADLEDSVMSTCQVKQS